MLICILFSHLLVNLVKCLSILQIFSQKPTLCFTDFFIVSIFIISVLGLIIFYHLFLFCMISSFCSRTLRCVMQLLLWGSLQHMQLVLSICLWELLWVCPISWGKLCFSFHWFLEKKFSLVLHFYVDQFFIEFFVQ